MSCGTSMLKSLSFIISVLCCIFGALTLSACAYALVEFDENEAIKTPCILGIVLATILVLNSFLGCCVASQNSIGVTWTYAILMLLLMILQIAVIFLEPVKFSNLADDMINEFWNSDLENEYAITSFEIKNECCGKYGPHDYNEIPASCYLNFDNTTEENLFKNGCVNQLSQMYSFYQHVEDISDWTLVGLEGASAFVAGLLAMTLKNVQRRKFYY